MANYVVLDNATHKDYKIDTRQRAEFGDAISAVPVVPREFSRLIADFPIVATKDGETGQFRLTALMGFQPGENLFLEDDAWGADYVPLNMQRQPFRVAQRTGSDPATPDLVITIDEDSPRITKGNGESLFLEFGGQTEFLQRVNSILSELVAGEAQSETFLATLLEHKLLESVNIAFEQPDGENVTVEGVFSVHDEQLNRLSPEQLEVLHRDGILELIYVMKASLVHIGAMINTRNRRSMK